MCDSFTPPSTTTVTPITTLDPLAGECKVSNEVLPHPASCHLYFMCIAQANGGFHVRVSK
jgi:hypothetical protein